MDIKLKDYIYIIYIALLPFTLTLIILRLNRIGLFTSKIYYYIIILCSVITLITFVWSLLYTLDDIIYKEVHYIFLFIMYVVTIANIHLYRFS